MRVSGPCIRREYRDPDFVEGCHGYLKRCARYVPKKEIWVEAMRNRADERHNLVHELFEWSFMKRGMGYDKAHARASSVEKAVRTHAGKLPCQGRY
jgi:hypothetical protein